ncbi:TIGR00730 family Rossman fold protein [Thioalkalivibrio sp. HK1]|uniref:LOG family protein n=1 Tax=Thioalkalivibrio sp. HK1 TaxID=1469245 RepID=UPI000471F199|nr:TIGR00730 family Rossman fold protein [Thioalkalivibrio sp. HK1]
MTTNAKRLCVFCGNQAGLSPTWIEAATTLGRAIAHHRIELVYGGGGQGMMGAVADAALEAKGRVIGVIPSDLFAHESLHRGIDEVCEVETMRERKSLMMDLSDGFIVLPGGVGTMDELFEIWALARIGIHSKPTVLLNIEGYYDSLVDFLDTMTASAYIGADDRAYLQVEKQPEAALARLSAVIEGRARD